MTGGVFSECCNKVGGINTPSHQTLYGVEHSVVHSVITIVQVSTSVLSLSEAYFPILCSAIKLLIPTLRNLYDVHSTHRISPSGKLADGLY